MAIVALNLRCTESGGTTMTKFASVFLLLLDLAAFALALALLGLLRL